MIERGIPDNGALAGTVHPPSLYFLLLPSLLLPAPAPLPLIEPKGKGTRPSMPGIPARGLLLLLLPPAEYSTGISIQSN